MKATPARPLRTLVALLLAGPLLLAFLVAAKPDDTGGPVTCFLPAVIDGVGVANVEGHGAVSADGRTYTCHARYSEGDVAAVFDGSGNQVGMSTVAGYDAHCFAAGLAGGNCPNGNQAVIVGNEGSTQPCFGILAGGETVFPSGTYDFTYRVNRNGNYALRCKA